MSSLSGVGLSRGYIPEDECKEQEPVIRAERITPQEQLNRLALSSLREVVCTKLDSLPDTLKESVVERAVQLILKRSGVSDERAEPQILSLFDRTITQLLKVKPLPSCLTNWHTALKRLSVLPKKSPHCRIIYATFLKANAQSTVIKCKLTEPTSKSKIRMCFILFLKSLAH